jgi:hypothetical protein
MFEQIALFATTFAWYVLSGRETIRARFDDGDELHLRLEARRRLDGELALALHVAPDSETLAAWREGLRGDRQVTIEAIEWAELSLRAADESSFISCEPCDRYPRVGAGIRRSEPGRTEWWTAMRGLEAFNALFDNSSSALGRQRRVLADLTGVELEILEPELFAFDPNDDSVRVAKLSAAGWQSTYGELHNGALGG